MGIGGDTKGLTGFNIPEYSCFFTVNSQPGQEGFQKRGEECEGHLHGVCSFPFKQSQTEET